MRYSSSMTEGTHEVERHVTAYSATFACERQSETGRCTRTHGDARTRDAILRQRRDAKMTRNGTPT